MPIIPWEKEIGDLSLGKADADEFSTFCEVGHVIDDYEIVFTLLPIIDVI